MTTWESSSRLAGTRIIWKLPSIISTPWWPGTRITRRARQWQCFTTPRWPRSTRTRKARAARLSAPARTGPANVGAPLDENPNIKPSDTRLVLNIAIERLRTDERNRTPKYQGGAGFIRLMRPPQGGSFLDQHEEGKRGNPQKIINPPTKSRAISIQQQPRQNRPWRMPLITAPHAPWLQ